MVHKKEINYFRERKASGAKTTFHVVRVGSWRSVNFKSRYLYFKNFLKNIIGHSISGDTEFSSRLGAKHWISTTSSFGIDRRGAAPKLKSRCIFVGRGRATSQEMFMTRHTFRRFLKLGLLPGFTKYTKL